MTEPKLEAVLALRSDGGSAVGQERIRLLEAVDRHGSITKAAQAVGLSYKAAWDGINAINNLLPQPAVAAQPGGRHGGGACVTEHGRALIAAFHLIEERLARAAGVLTDGNAPFDSLALLRSLGMRTSARNAFRCQVREVRFGDVNAEVLLRLTDEVGLASVITAASARGLGLEPGREVTALIKSSLVVLALGETPPLVSARNRIRGVVASREDGPVDSEIILDLGGGKTLAATVTRTSAEELALAPGSTAWALIKAPHVILAVD